MLKLFQEVCNNNDSKINLVGIFKSHINGEKIFSRNPWISIDGTNISSSNNEQYTQEEKSFINGDSIYFKNVGYDKSSKLRGFTFKNVNI